MILGAVSLSSAWSAMGAAVLHFLWQGALIGLFAGLLLGCLRQRSSAERYAVACGAMLLCLLSFFVSFATALADLSLTAGARALQASLATGESASGLPMHSEATGIAAWCWAVGVLCMALRFALQCYGAHRLKTTAVFEADSSWHRAFHSLKEELGISHNVRLLRSGLAQVPMVVGWFSPIVLVPASAFTGLSPDQLRSLIAHELAHIRRHDHLLNAAQAVVEIVLFFHPVVWWISKQVRLEREYCCDDSSVRLTGDPRLLAEALATMETLRTHQPMTHTVLAANGGPLMQRIARILGARLDGRTSLTSWHLPAGFVLAGVLAVAGSAYATPTLIVNDDAVEQQDRRPNAKKVWAELQADVDAGKITEAQARERFARWEKENAGQKQDPAAARRVWAELEAMVKAGKMTEAQARERFAGWEKKNAEQKSDKANPQEVWAKLQAAVKAGKLTEAQAKEEFAAYRKSLAKRGAAQEKADPEAVIKRIQVAVETGRLTPEEGKARIEAYMKGLAEDRAAQKKELEAVIRRIQAAVDAGELTPEQGKARIEGYKERLAGKKVTRKEDPEAVIKRIQAAVESGRLTPEQGKERIEAYKKSLAERKSLGEKKAAERKEYVEGMIRKIQAAVDEGELTPEEGKARIEALKKGLAERTRKENPEKNSEKKRGS